MEINANGIDEKKIARLYIRVSTEDQAREGYSLEAQRENLTKYVKELGYEFGGIYTDVGFSAKNVDRPALQQMLLDAKQDIFDVLVTLSPDRLSRNIIDQGVIRDLLAKSNVQLKFWTLPVDTTSPEGDLITNILGSVSQYERRLISRRVKIGMTQKAQKGGFNGMAPPYGYDIVDGDLIINKKEAEVVRCIFRMHELTMYLESITNLLNEFDVPTKKGGTWSKKQVWRILNSMIVRGYLHWDGIVVKGSHEPIIEDEFDKGREGPMTVEVTDLQNMRGRANG
jgi:site-specific DNA recombinase